MNEKLHVCKMAVSMDSDKAPWAPRRTLVRCVCPLASADVCCASARRTDGRFVYSTDALECMLIARRGMLPEEAHAWIRRGMLPEEAHAWIRRCTQDTRAWGPDYLD